MLLTPIQTRPVPIQRWEDGSLRVGDSRVHIDFVVYKYHEGKTPQEIVTLYDALTLSDVYATIAWYLDNQVIVDAFIAQREREAKQLWQKIEAKPAYQDHRQMMRGRFQKYRDDQQK